MARPVSQATTGPAFRDRHDAGQQVARLLRPLRRLAPVVLGLPRGGVPVAAAIADELGAVLDVVLVRKLGVPHQPELAFGAIGEADIRVLSEEVISSSGTTKAEVADVEVRARRELERQSLLYRAGRHSVPLSGRTVLLVDDGVATGSTAAAACLVVRASGAARIAVAAPVAPAPVVVMLERFADQVVVVHQPDSFFSIGQWYDDFSQTTDDEVIRLLSASGRPNNSR